MPITNINPRTPSSISTTTSRATIQILSYQTPVDPSPRKSSFHRLMLSDHRAPTAIVTLIPPPYGLTTPSFRSHKKPDYTLRASF